MSYPSSKTAQTNSVLLTMEGTYPFFEGGVSTWCHELIKNMPDVSFTLLSMIAQPGSRPVYQLSPNVTKLITMPLWGTSSVSEMRKEVGGLDLHRMRTRAASLHRNPDDRFEEAFSMLLNGLFDPQRSMETLGEGLRQLARYFATHDYDATFRAQRTWDIYQSCVARWMEDLRPGASIRSNTRSNNLQQEILAPNSHELAEGLRLLYRWFSPIAMPLAQFHLIHASAAGLASLPGIIAHLEYGTPLLLTEHGVYLRERYLAWSRANTMPYIKLMATRVLRRLVELSYATADLICPVSSWNIRWEEKLGADPQRIKPIANGVDPSRFSAQPMPADDPPTIVWMGRIDPLKDLITLIDAVYHIKEAIPKVQVLLYGKAPAGGEAYEAECRARQQKLGLEDTIRFMGFASKPQDVYCQSHIAVLSSVSEALPFSVIEAMSCARSVVGTAVGGVPEVIGNTGRLVQPRDATALAAACIEMLSDPGLCAQLGLLARERALQCYTLDSIIKEYQVIYEQLTSNSLAVTFLQEASTPPADFEERSPSQWRILGRLQEANLVGSLRSMNEDDRAAEEGLAGRFDAALAALARGELVHARNLLARVIRDRPGYTRNNYMAVNLMADIEATLSSSNGRRRNWLPWGRVRSRSHST